MEGLPPSPSHALLLDEALYHVACDYYLRDHVLWPLYRHSSPVSEPFAAYFELWKHGVALRLGDDGIWRAFAPSLAG